MSQPVTTVEELKASKPRGFATLTPERRREIASMGGKAVPPEKRGFSRYQGLAARAGRIGGRHPKPRSQP